MSMGIGRHYIIRRDITTKLYIMHYGYVIEVIVKYCDNTPKFFNHDAMTSIANVQNLGSSNFNNMTSCPRGSEIVGVVVVAGNGVKSVFTCACRCRF